MADPSEAATSPPECARCGRPVERSRESYAVFEQMHWVCFHYEFEHDPRDPDAACGDPTCPSRAFDKDAPPDWFMEQGLRLSPGGLIPLLRAVADALVFLEFVPDDELRQDLAVRIMEDIASSLRALDPKDRRVVTRGFTEIANDYGPTDEQADFVRSIGSSTGIEA